MHNELDLIVAVLRGYPDSLAKTDAMRAVGVIRAALAAQQVCPVCQGQGRIYQGCGSWIHCSNCNTTGKVHAALAEQPAAPGPVLTDAEIEAIWSEIWTRGAIETRRHRFARAILAAAIPPGHCVVPVAALNKAIAYSEPGHAKDVLQALLPDGSTLAARPGAPR